jgi:hypothetical protein
MATTSGTPGGLAERLAAGVPDRGVSLAYGPPQKVEGVEFVPVAFVSYGFGAGEDLEQLGSGGGAGGVAIPMGAYVGEDGGIQFRGNSIATLALAISLVSTVGFAIARIVKAAK